jgi:hypothetical protein
MLILSAAIVAPAQSITTLKAQAKRGSVDAQYNLGVAYATGQGVQKDESEAASWYRKAAEQGDAGAQSSLADAYAFGKGVPKDYSHAVAWYRKSAEQGDAGAQYNLGVLYTDGDGVQQDYPRRTVRHGSFHAGPSHGAQFAVRGCPVLHPRH